MVSRKVEDASSILPKRGQFDELTEVQLSRSRREIARTVTRECAVVHNFAAQRTPKRAETPRDAEVRISISYRPIEFAENVEPPDHPPAHREIASDDRQPGHTR